MTVSDIIELLGGVKAVSEDTGWPYTTVDSWRDAGSVPDWRRAKLLEMALVNDKPLRATDFPDRPQKAAA